MNRLPSAVLLGQFALLGASPALAQTFCPPVDFPPTGQTVSPSNAFNEDEYAWCHSSTNLQGAPAYEKTAASLFFNPPGALGTGVPRAFGAFSSAVVVNNPSNAFATNVTIDYFDPAGNLLGTTGPVNIAPNGTFIESAATLLSNGGTGVGSARVAVVDPTIDAPILGATLHYFDSIFVPGWGVVVNDPDAFSTMTGQVFPTGPGEGSYQQLQVTPGDGSNEGGWIFAGPFRITNAAPTDFENGAVPVLSIANPYDERVNCIIAILGSDPSGLFVISTRAVTIPARGSELDTTLWTGVNQLTANSAGNYDFNLMAVVIAADSEGRPCQLLGDALVIDAFGDNPAQRNLVVGGRMRMTSSMFSDQPFSTLIAHEVGSFTPAGSAAPMLASATHVLNVGFLPAGPINIQYFDRSGVLTGNDVVASLLPGSALHIGEGQANSPNFPANQWNGWVRVSATCGSDRLIGWTHREIGPRPGATVPPMQFRKAYGEEMLGANRFEPGQGIVLVSDLGVGEVMTRKVMPLIRTTPFGTPGFWPGYTTFTNTGFIPNIGDYSYRFFNVPGADLTSPFVPLQVGVASLATSFSYEDSDPAPFMPFSTLTGNGSGRIDQVNTNLLPFASNYDGVNVLGDPFWEFGIPGFAIRNLGPRSVLPVPIIKK